MLGPRSMAFCSYVAVALYAVFSAPVIAQQGQLGGTFLIYLVSAVGLCLWAPFSSALRRELSEAPRTFRSGKLLALLALLLATNCIGAISYYQGLGVSGNPAEYGIFGRLEPVFLVLSGIVVLGERVSGRKLLGLVIAFAASGFLLRTWSVSSSALFYGGIYVAAMTLGGVLVKVLMNLRAASPLLLLLLRTVTVCCACAAAFGFSEDMSKVTAALRSPGQLYHAVVTGGTMLLIIGFRYQSLSRIPLWEFSAMAPVSAVVGTLILWGSGVSLGIFPAIAMVMIGIGEALAYTDARPGEDTAPNIGYSTGNNPDLKR